MAAGDLGGSFFACKGKGWFVSVSTRLPAEKTQSYEINYRT